MEDKDLFELSEAIYEKTAWKTKEAYGKALTVGNGSTDWYDMEAPWDVFEQTDALENGYEFICPLYTSDYILDRLKDIRIDVWHDGHVVVKRQRHNGIPEKVERKYGDTIKVEAESTLKALLKLTLALHEAGELE